MTEHGYAARECNSCGLCGKDCKKYTIKCPQCGVVYETKILEKTIVRCMDCGAEYLQPIHNTANSEFIRAAAYRCRG